MVSVRVIIIQFFCKIEFGRGTCNLDQHIYKALLLKIQFFIFIFLILKKTESWEMISHEFIENIGIANSTLHFRANTFFPYSHHFIITQFYQRRFSSLGMQMYWLWPLISEPHPILCDALKNSASVIGHELTKAMAEKKIKFICTYLLNN